MKKNKKRFGGRSFGGIQGGGTIIFSKHHKLEIYKDKKTKQWQTIIKKKRLPLNLPFFLFMFPVIDLFFYMVGYNFNLIIRFLTIPSDFIIGLFGKETLSKTLLPMLSIPLWIWHISLFCFLIFFLLLLYFVGLRGVSTWHGCEHKVIIASENDDTDNAKKYNPISDRCGSTYLLTIYILMGLYWLISVYFIGLVVPVGVMTLVIIMMIFESRFFHKYNKLGIWIGKQLQLYCTVKEPFDWQLNLGIKGMKELVDIEYNGKTIKS